MEFGAKLRDPHPRGTTFEVVTCVLMLTFWKHKLDSPVPQFVVRSSNDTKTFVFV
jgi:hypothetical protein